MHGKSFVCLLALACAGFSTAQAAGDAGQPPTRGFFVGVDVGRSDSDVDTVEFFSGPELVRTEGDATGFRLRAGYQFNQYLAIEGSFVSLGEFTIDGIPYTCASGDPPPCTYEVRTETQGVLFNVVGSWPFADRWSAKARAGISRLSGKTRQHDPDIPGSARSFDRYSAGFVFGFGVAARVTRNLEAELAWSRFNQIGFSFSVDDDVAANFEFGKTELLTVGLTYRF